MDVNDIEVIDLCKKYNDFELKKVNLIVPKGCVVGFIGENGAGKSTTIKAILNLINEDSGTINIFGKNKNSLLEFEREDIGVVLDEMCFPENLKIKELSKVLNFMFKKWDNASFLKYAIDFALPLDKIIKNFSKGMKMKLSIAVALSHNCSLLILDEPTSGLDPAVRHEIIDIFFKFISDGKHSVLMSSHIVSDLEKICDYIVLIHNGKILFQEEKDMLLGKYGILKCNKNEFDILDKTHVIGSQITDFGVHALVEKNYFGDKYLVEKATLEDIMLYKIGRI